MSLRTNKWCSYLFNHRAANVLRALLLCLALLVTFIICTARTIQKQPLAVNNVIDIGSSVSSAAPAYDQSGHILKKISPQFVKAHQLLNANIDLCISQCRAYKEAWYPQGEVANPINTSFQLTDSMSSNLDVIRKNYDLLKSDELRFVLMSGGKQSKCDNSIARLAALHEEMYIKANSYHSVYDGLETILSEAEIHKNELNSEMSDCLQ